MDFTESVRIKWLLIRDKLDKHVDKLLAQISDRIEEIQKIEIKLPSRSTDIDTICYITLANKQHHPTLIYLLNNYVFHGRTIQATPSSYTIRTLSSSHILDPIQCTDCEQYTEWIQQGEIKIMKRAINETINTVYEQQLATAKGLIQRSTIIPTHHNNQPVRINNGTQISHPASPSETLYFDEIISAKPQV